MLHEIWLEQWVRALENGQGANFPTYGEWLKQNTNNVLKGVHNNG